MSDRIDRLEQNTFAAHAEVMATQIILRNLLLKLPLDVVEGALDNAIDELTAGCLRLGSESGHLPRSLEIAEQIRETIMGKKPPKSGV